MKSTFDLSTNEGKIRMFNAKESTGVSMKSLEDGTVIHVVDIVQYESQIDQYNGVQDVVITCLFDKDGNSYSAISETIASAGSSLIDLVKELQLEEYPVKISKNKSSKGQEFLTLSLAMWYRKEKRIWL